MTIEIRRAFEFARQNKPAGAHIVLLDRAWPRGVRKDHLDLNEWARHLAPESTLLKAGSNGRLSLEAVIERHDQKLRAEHVRELQRLRQLAEAGDGLLLLYSARDPVFNGAAIIREILAPTLRQVA
jgi:uncharacterized protein YeaO (DUF488 family)